jgi:hypothetical protein
MSFNVSSFTVYTIIPPFLSAVVGSTVQTQFLELPAAALLHCVSCIHVNKSFVPRVLFKFKGEKDVSRKHI